MEISRRKFLSSVSLLAAVGGTLSSRGFSLGSKKLKVTLVGTGIRGTTFWGKRLVD